MDPVLRRYDEAKPSKDQRNAFDCGHPSLNRWLAQQAGQSMTNRDAVTHLLLDESAAPADIVGYYCLSSGQVSRKALPAAMAKGAPEPVPAVRMGRLAISLDHQGHGWGADLLREALLGAVAVGNLIGARVMLVDAIDDHALAFYKRFGFAESPVHPMQVLYDLRVVAQSGGLPLG